MRLRNNIFAAAFDYLKRNKGIKTQKRLAELMGVSEDTITRILKDRTEVTEDIITKLQTASGCIFNLQWLRGEDPFRMLAIDAEEASQHTIQQKSQIEQSSLVNALLARADEQITSLERSLAYKDQTIEILREQNAKIEREKDARIENLQELVAQLRSDLNEAKAIIATSGSLIDKYSFPIGAADAPSIHKRI